MALRTRATLPPRPSTAQKLEQRAATAAAANAAAQSVGITKGRTRPSSAGAVRGIGGGGATTALARSTSVSDARTSNDYGGFVSAEAQ